MKWDRIFSERVISRGAESDEKKKTTKKRDSDFMIFKKSDSGSLIFKRFDSGSLIFKRSDSDSLIF